MLSPHFFLLYITLVCHAALFHSVDRNVAAFHPTDIGYFKKTGGVLENIKATANLNSKTTASAAELDILMPPIEFTEAIAGIADVTFSPLNINKKSKNENVQAPNWKHAYDTFLVALGVIVMLVIIAFVTHCIWRRHIERRSSERETENARIFCSTPHYIDPSQLLVY